MYVFLICLGLSLFIWAMVKLSDESEAEVAFDVVYTAAPYDHILVNEPAQKINLHFEEKASSLAYLQLFKRKSPVNISLANINLIQKGDKYYGYLFTSHMVDYISRQLELETNIMAISPDTLVFIFEDKASRKVPVRLETDITLEKQYVIYDSIRINPDSVMVSGPSSMVDTITFAMANKISFSNVKQTQELTLTLDGVDKFPLLAYSPSEVNITIPIEEYTEASLDIPVAIAGNQDLNLRILPETVKVTYLVALKDYNQVSAEMFSCVADFSGLDILANRRIKVQVINAPSFIKSTRLDPETVEYIILKQ